MKSGSGSGGGVCVCDGARSGLGGEVSARESFAVRRRGECEGEARRSIVIARPLPLIPRDVRGVIGLEPNANTRGGGGRESESRERCDANWCRSISGPCWEQLGTASRSCCCCCCCCGGGGPVWSDLEDGFSGAAIVPVACCRRLNVSLGELAGEGMSCRDRVGAHGGCDTDLGSG